MGGGGGFLSSALPLVGGVAGALLAPATGGTSAMISSALLGSSLGGMAMPWMIGQLIDPVGPHVAMLIISVGLALDLALLIVMTSYVSQLELKRALD